MRKLFIKILTPLLVLTLLADVQSQQIILPGQPGIRHFTNEQYQAYRQNWSLHQSPRTGFMYAGNTRGLLEFDGSFWKVYETPAAIRSVMVHENGRIFTGSLGEFGYWEPDERGQLIYHSLRPLIPDKGFDEEAVWNIIQTPEGILFQSFAYVFLYNGKTIRRLKTPANVLFVHLVNDRLWVEGIGKGIYELSGGNFRFVEGSGFLGKTSVHAFLPGSRPGEMLICSDKGVYRYDGKSFSPFGAGVNAFFLENQLNRAMVLDHERLVFGTILNGIVITDFQGNILQHINRKSGLQNNTVLALCKDREGGLWLGLDNGIDLVSLNVPVRYFSDTEGSMGAVFDAALFGSKLYVGTNHGLFVSETGRPEYDFKLVPGTLGQVWDLEVIDGQLFCGHNEGTFVIHNGQTRRISSVTGGWVIRRLRKHPDYLVQGTYTRLCLYRRGIFGNWEFAGELAGISGPVNQLEEDAEGFLWVNQPFKGIARYRPDPAAGKVYPVAAFEAPWFRDAGTSLGKILDRIVVTTPQGVYSYHSESRKLQIDQSLLQGAGGRTLVKLFSFSPGLVLAIDKEKNIGVLEPGKPFSEIPLKRNKWVDGSENIISIDHHNLLFCAEDGFSVFPRELLPGLLKEKRKGPMVRGIYFADTPGLNRYFYGNKIPEVILKHNENNFSIGFGLPEYARIPRYSYRLEGLNEGWSAFSTVTRKEFSRLQPGKYTFHLRSDLSNEETTFSFEIAAPWYWSTWSKLLYMAGLAAFFYWLYHLHVRRLRFQHEQLREAHEQRHREQNEKNRQEIVRMRTEQLESDLIRKSEELANSMMTLIRKNELLTRIKEEVQNPLRSPRQIITLIDKNISSEQDWKLFESNFNKVHEAFLKRLLETYPDLTHGDLKLAAYLRMNLSTKEIAQLLNITMRSVELKRYRLRQKLNMTTEENLADFILKF